MNYDVIVFRAYWVKLLLYFLKKKNLNIGVYSFLINFGIKLEYIRITLFSIPLACMPIVFSFYEQLVNIEHLQYDRCFANKSFNIVLSHIMDKEIKSIRVSDSKD